MPGSRERSSSYRSSVPRTKGYVKKISCFALEYSCALALARPPLLLPPSAVADGKWFSRERNVAARVLRSPRSSKQRTGCVRAKPVRKGMMEESSRPMERPWVKINEGGGRGGDVCADIQAA